MHLPESSAPRPGRSTPGRMPTEQYCTARRPAQASTQAGEAEARTRRRRLRGAQHPVELPAVSGRHSRRYMILVSLELAARTDRKGGVGAFDAPYPLREPRELIAGPISRVLQRFLSRCQPST
jgi:hypothetical protein